MPKFKPGQKWISNAEPELGLGEIVSTDGRKVCIRFPLSAEERTYSEQNAPLIRVAFNEGDQLTSLDGRTLYVESVTEHDGLLSYHGGPKPSQEKKGRDSEGHDTIAEIDLDHNMQFSRPQERMFTHQIDPSDWFNLRYWALSQQEKLATILSRGLLGPRVSLIPHQLYIGNEVSSRYAPRVLLADEVGLGKTIEAGLIVHQQLHTARASRVLVIVPSALIFQWFVEMIRRFNLQFIIMDEDRCTQIEYDHADVEDLMDKEEQRADDEASELSRTDVKAFSADDFNPFQAQQLVLCSLDLFEGNDFRLQQAMHGEFDLLVVDEAHHLTWSETKVSDKYKIVEQLAAAIDGVLLLTATPEQLGRSGHFARLRLLDPNRFYDYDVFVREETAYQPIAKAVNDLLLADDEARQGYIENISRLTNQTTSQTNKAGVDDIAMERFVRQLTDQHGTGRVLFRNVRSSVQGFTSRKLTFTALECPRHYLEALDADSLFLSLYPEITESNWLRLDPRVYWLESVLLSISPAKCLVICAHAQTALQLEEHLRLAVGMRTTAFHEGMDLIARDRAAAYFAEADHGARVLISSEIGSEGRNFQFSHHLVLFDLPLNPDLLEQRLGRLDRIGQTEDVTIHLPYLAGTAQEVLFRWFHEGMNLFEEANPAGPMIYADLEQDIPDLLAAVLIDGNWATLDEFIAKTKALNENLGGMLSEGRDRLLEFNSHRPDISSMVIEDIVLNQGGSNLQDFMALTCRLYGLEDEPIGKDTYLIKPTESMVRNQAASLETQQRYRFPELPEEGVRVTYDRDTALVLEDIVFLSWESPMVQQALDLVTSDIMGNSCMVVLQDSSFDKGTMLLETLHLVECVAPPKFQIERYLPPRLIRAVIDSHNRNIADSFPFQTFEGKEVSIAKETLMRIIDSQGAGIRQMIQRAEEESLASFEHIKEDALRVAREKIELELTRLTDLKKINPNVRQEEIDHWQDTARNVAGYITNARTRLDALRLIVFS